MRLTKSYRPLPFKTPITYSVHKVPDHIEPWKVERNELVPALPSKVLGRGYPCWEVEHKGQVLYFASLEEIQHVIDVLGKKNIPRTYDLARNSGVLNRHWRSRLHKTWLPWRVRQNLVKVLKAELAE